MTAAQAVLIDLAPAPVRSVPFDHVLKEGYLEPSLYQALRASFPTCPTGSGPSGHNLYLGEPGLDDLLARSAAWRSFVGAVRSQAYVEACLAQFRDELHRGGCLVDPARARYVPWTEPRAVKEQREVTVPHPEPHELFVRVDLHQAGAGYGRDVHVDHRRRLITALIYSCDADEIAMQGGRLSLWPRPTARLSWLARRRERTITPRHNLGALFACSRRSYHRVDPITRQSGTRDRGRPPTRAVECRLICGSTLTRCGAASAPPRRHGQYGAKYGAKPSTEPGSNAPERAKYGARLRCPRVYLPSHHAIDAGAQLMNMGGWLRSPQLMNMGGWLRIPPYPNS